ncbi:MAG: cyclopropane-fatty-acyl-phospholipid synthase family protein, partial [Parvibaculaceae bacterium]
REQLKVAQRRAEERGVAEKVEFRLQDYRAIKENFDRIVSVGMFEHVGVGHYAEYFGGVRHLLAPEGVALIHTIGRLDPPGATNPWIAKYIFPGGYIPALSEMAGAVERSGLLMTDVEVLRLHYAETLREWRKRFMERRETAARIYDERFCRMWEFYLAGSETSFRNEGMVVFQMQIAKSLQSLPLSREYMVDEERRLNAGAEPAPRRLLAGD